MKHSNAPRSTIRARAEEIGEPRPMRRGSVTERYVRCNKANCRCKEDPEARHGPYLSLTRAVDGVTRTRLLTAAQAELSRHQIQEGREFRDATELYWKICERAADAELEALEQTEQGAEKKGSSRSSPRKSRPRSKRS
jgi:hypothetical protein